MVCAGVCTYNHDSKYSYSLKLYYINTQVLRIKSCDTEES